MQTTFPIFVDLVAALRPALLLLEDVDILDIRPHSNWISR
jgi:hypothetical protein